MTSVTIGPATTVPPVEPGASNAVQPAAVPASAAPARGGSQHPNPSLRLDSQLGLVVIEFFDRSGAVSRTIPSAQQLAAYRQWSETGRGANPLTGQTTLGGKTETATAASNSGHTQAAGAIGQLTGDATAAATNANVGTAPTLLAAALSGAPAAGPTVGGLSSDGVDGGSAAPATGTPIRTPGTG